jgi:hypothetical protein
VSANELEYLTGTADPLREELELAEADVARTWEAYHAAVKAHGAADEEHREAYGREMLLRRAEHQVALGRQERARYRYRKASEGRETEAGTVLRRGKGRLREAPGEATLRALAEVSRAAVEQYGGAKCPHCDGTGRAG